MRVLVGWDDDEEIELLTMYLEAGGTEVRVTLVYGVVENGILGWTSAGHCMPLLQDLETGRIIEAGDATRDGGPPLGIYDEACRRQTLDELFRQSLAFTGGHGRHDDTSVLLLERSTTR